MSECFVARRARVLGYRVNPYRHCQVCGGSGRVDIEPIDVHGMPEVHIQPSLHSMEEVYRIGYEWAQDFASYTDEELETALRCLFMEECEEEEDARATMDDFLTSELSDILARAGFTYVLSDDDYMAVFRGKE